MQEFKKKERQSAAGDAASTESSQQRRVRLRSETIAALTGTGVTIFAIDVSSTSERCH